MGDAMVTTDQLRLTPDKQSRQGAVWSRLVSSGGGGGIAVSCYDIISICTGCR